MPSFIAVLLAAVVACSSPGSSSPDAPASAPDADPSCPDRAAATIGPAGGAVEHCAGARLDVPADALGEAALLSITRVAVDPSPGAPYVETAGAYAFEGPAGLAFAALVGIEVPHGGAEPRGRVELARLDEGGWQTLESCPPEETTVRQDLSVLGTYAALHDPTPYAETSVGLGEGSIDYELEGAGTGTLAVDPQGLAIDYDLTADGRNLTIVYRRNDETGLVQVQLDFSIDAAGAVVPVSVSFYDSATTVIWSNDVFLHPEQIGLRVTSDAGGTIEGTIDAELYASGNPTPRTLTASFTAHPEHYRFPPERVCGPAGGG